MAVTLRWHGIDSDALMATNGKCPSKQWPVHRLHFVLSAAHQTLSLPYRLDSVGKDGAGVGTAGEGRHNVMISLKLKNNYTERRRLECHLEMEPGPEEWGQ